MITPEEQGLIQQCIAGDRVAQGNLYKRYVKAMFHIAVRMVADRDLAMDLTQDVFIKVFSQLNSFKGTATLGAWMKRITINTCLNYLNKAGKLRTKALEEETMNIPYQTENVIPQVDMKQIHNAIKSLPAGSRVVTNLYLIEGYQHKEIASILGVSESTSKTQYRRGRILLQEKLILVLNHER